MSGAVSVGRPAGLRDRRGDERGGAAEQRVEPGHGLEPPAAGREVVVGRHGEPLEQELAGARMQQVRIPLDPLAAEHRGVLRGGEHEPVLVGHEPGEEAAGLPVLHGHAEQLGEPVRALVERRGDLGRQRPEVVGALGHDQPLRQARGRQRHGQRRRVAVDGAGDDVEQQREVVGGRRHEAVRRQVDPVGRDAAADHAVGRLVAEQPAERRGDADGAAAVGAGRDDRQPRGERGGGSAARAAGGEVGVPRVAGGAEEEVVGEALDAELGHVRLADDDAARRAQPADGDAVGLGGRRIGEPAGAVRGAHAAHVVVVLREHRQPSQRARVLAPADGGVDGVRLGQRLVGAQRGHRIQVARAQRCARATPRRGAARSSRRCARHARGRGLPESGDDRHGGRVAQRGGTMEVSSSYATWDAAMPVSCAWS